MKRRMRETKRQRRRSGTAFKAKKIQSFSLVTYCFCIPFEFIHNQTISSGMIYFQASNSCHDKKKKEKKKKEMQIILTEPKSY